MKNTFTNQLDSFYDSIKMNKKIIYTDKIGLLDATLASPASSDMKIREIFIYRIYNNLTSLISNYKFKKEENEKNDFDLMRMDQLVKKLYIEKEIKNEKIKSEKNKETSFKKISLSNRKILFLEKSNLLFVGIFDTKTVGGWIKLYLLHIHTAFINFLGDSLDLIINNKKCEENLTTTQEVGTKEILHVGIFEIFFLKTITSHFINTIKILFENEDIYISNTKFKNLFVLDMSTGEIILNFKAVNNKKHKKLKRNEKLWEEILQQSRYLLRQYEFENGTKFSSKNSKYNFVKFECTSTYPRLIFVIKFLPILNGITIVHVLSQNKLSRSSGEDKAIAILANYNKIDILYGHDCKDKKIEVIYKEPKKLKEFEKFLIEFLVPTVPGRNKEKFFHDLSHSIIYFDYYLMTVIDEIANKSIAYTYEIIITNILKKLFELYTNGTESEPMRIKTINQNIFNSIQNKNAFSSANAVNIFKGEENSISLEQNYPYTYQGQETISQANTNMNIYTYYMNINRDYILRNIFYFSQNQSHDDDLSNGHKSNLDKNNTLQLSIIEETQTKINARDNDFFLNFNDVSQIENVKEDDGNILMSSIKTRNTIGNELISKKNFVAINDSILKVKFPLLASNGGRVLLPKYSRTDKKIDPEMSSQLIFKLNAEEDLITIKQNNSIIEKKNPGQAPVHNMFHSSNYEYNSSLEKKKDHFKNIIFNEKSLHSFSLHEDLIIEDKNLEDDKDKNFIEYFEKVKDNINGGNDTDQLEIKKSIEGYQVTNFMYTYPLGDEIRMRDRIPTFKAMTEHKNFSKDTN